MSALDPPAGLHLSVPQAWVFALWARTTSSWTHDVPGAFDLAIQAWLPAALSRERLRQIVDYLAHLHGEARKIWDARRERDIEIGRERRAEEARLRRVAGG